MLRWLTAGLGVALALGAVVIVPARVEGQPPNLILIVADDLGHGDLGSYGQTRLHTPTLDRLATEGTRLTAAYSSAPVCAPSRCSILTGLHAGHCAVHTNAEPNTPLSPDDATLAEVLGAAGYRTGIMGKWGLGGELRDGSPFATWSAPWNVEFGTVLVSLNQELAQEHYPAWLWRDQGAGAGVREAIEANVGAHVVFDDDRFVDAALAFIDDAITDGQPFFLYLPLTLPHRELDPPDLGLYASEPWPLPERAYAAMVTRIDTDVGRLTARLAERGALDHTVLLFTSDHGPTSVDGHEETFFDSSAGLRGQKRDLYEGGTRVPLIAWGTGVAAGATVATPVSLTDLLPTLAELAGASSPSGLDGVSIAAGLHGGALPRAHAAIYTAVERGAGSESGTRRALRADDLKLVERADGTVELYDLSVDPLEAHDIAGEHRTEVEALRARIAIEERPRRIAGDPTLRLVSDDLRDRIPTHLRRHVPVLHLVLDGERASPTRIESALSVPSLTATMHEGPVRYASVPAHPALSVGDESFTIEAFVRLDEAASPPGREWLVTSKQTGRSDAFLDFGVLVRAGDLAHGDRIIGSSADRTGRELALVFGDPRLGHSQPWGVVSSLSVDDGEVHRVSVRFDAPRDRVRFSIDDRTETVEIVDRGHVAGDGPLVLGAHHDEHGVFDGELHGDLLELRMSRGLVSVGHRLERGEASPSGDTVTIDLGRLLLGAEASSRTFRIENAGDGRLRGVDVAIDADGISDDRLTLEGVASATLFSRGDRTAPLTLRFDPSREGPLDTTFVVRGTVRRRGWAAARSPLRVRVVGSVVGESEPDGGLPAILVLVVLLALPVALLLWLRRR